MTIKKLEGGQYEVDIRPNGRNGRRIRRKFSKKGEAVAFVRYVSANHRNKEWLQKPTDKRKLSELIDIWWQFHGLNSDHGQNYLLKLRRFSEITGNPAAFQINRNLIARYKSVRLQSGVKASTVNREMTTISGAFTQLIESGIFHGEHPIRGTGSLKEAVPEMSFLYDHEIQALLANLDGDNRRLAVLMLSTGGNLKTSNSPTLFINA